MPNSALSPMPTAGTLDGSELYYTVQNSLDRKVGGLQMKRTLLTANITYYVSTTGNDVITGGTSAAPWATVQYALDYIDQHIDIAGFIVTVQLAAGTTGSPNIYGSADLGSFTGGGEIRIETSDGDPTHTTMSSAVATIKAFNNSTTTVGLGGMTITSSGDHCIDISADIFLYIGTTNCPSITLGPCGNNQYLVGVNDHGTFADNFVAASAVTLTPQASGCNGYVEAYKSGAADLGASSYTIVGTPAWGTAFLRVDSNSDIQCDIDITFNSTGSSTGNRFNATRNGSLASIGTLTNIPGANTAAGGLGVCLNAVVSDGSGARTFIQSDNVLIHVESDKGTLGSTTVTFAVLVARFYKVTLSSSLTVAFSTWSSAGIYSETNLEIVNGAAGIDWPTMKWNIGTGTWSSSFPGSVTLSTGTNFVKAWSTDNGTTIYGSAM